MLRPVPVAADGQPVGSGEQDRLVDVHPGPGQDCTNPEGGVDPSATQVSVGQVEPFGAGPGQVGAAEVAAGHVGPPQVRLAQPQAGQIDAGQIRAGQRHQGQVAVPDGQRTGPAVGEARAGQPATHQRHPVQRSPFEGTGDECAGAVGTVVQLGATEAAVGERHPAGVHVDQRGLAEIAAGEGDTGQFLAGQIDLGEVLVDVLGLGQPQHRDAQWKKCRVPVKYMLTPPASAAAITSGSRTEPPGWTMARTPAAMRISGPSANGKNASDAATDPLARSPARSTASRAESTRFTCPMPMPTDAPPAASRIAFDFTDRQARQAKARSVRVASSTGSPAARVQFAGSSPGASIRSRVWASTPPEMPRNSTGSGAVCAGITSSRMFFLRVSTATASSAKPGARTTSVNTSAICSAMATVTGRLAAITPPKADTGSHSWASRWARAISSSVPPAIAAMPHGLACLMTATAGSVKSPAARQAASTST